MKEKNVIKKIIREIKRLFWQTFDCFRLYPNPKRIRHNFECICQKNVSFEDTHQKIVRTSTQNFDFFSDGLGTSNNCDFLTDPKFIHAHEAGKATTPEFANCDFRWRQRIVLWAAEYASQLEGDFVECGVNRGYYSRMIFEYIPFTTLGKTFWLLDTYQGFVAEQLSQEEWKNQGPHLVNSYSPCYDAVCKTFQPFGDCV